MCHIYKTFFGYVHPNVHRHKTREAGRLHIPIVRKELKNTSIFDFGDVTCSDIMSIGIRFYERDIIF